jgi:hypothetical protein
MAKRKASQFDSRPLKVRNRPDFLACKWHATYCWKALDKGYNFALDLISIGGLHTKLWCPKVVGFLTLGILGFPFGSLGTKCHLDVGLMRGTEYTIREKLVASPKSRPWWVLWVRVYSWFVLASKVLQLCTNQLVVWFYASACEWLRSCYYF